MDPDHQGTAQTVSFFLRTILLFACIAVYQKAGKGKIFNRNTLPAAKPVAVVKETKPIVKKKKKKIYLTFDDGPNRGTQKVLHIMQEEQVPVTFFVIGEHVFASTSQQQTWDSLKMAKQIELCNHSYSHAEHNHYERFYDNPDSVINDFKHSQDTLSLDNNICRTPGRNTWRIDTLQYTDLKKSKMAVDSLEKAGFAIMGWDLEWHYNAKDLTLQNTADDLMRQIDSVFAHRHTRTPEQLVLLAHDQVYADANDSIELHNFIRLLKANENYELELVSNYPGVKN